MSARRWAACRRAYRLLRKALAGDTAARARVPWAVPGTVDAVAMPLDGCDVDGIQLWAASATGQRPPHLRVGHDQVPLRWLPAVPRPRLHSGAARNVGHDSGTGAIATLLRDRLDPGRRYVLSCAHVLAGHAGAAFGDAVDISVGTARGQGRLIDWMPGFGQTLQSAGIDAAIAEVEPRSPLVAALQALALPRDICAEFRYEQAITVRAPQFKSGRLLTRWSGYIDIEQTERDGDYFLENGVTYRTDPPTTFGDSGSAVWDDSDRLLGIHCAAPVGDERWHANGVMCPIDRIMDWFDVDPLLQGGFVAVPPRVAPAAGTRVEPPGAPAAPSAARAMDIEVVAKTLWGEARGEGEQGMRAVAGVIGNRERLRWQRQVGFSAICRARSQFSCWNDRDANRRKLDTIDRHPDGPYRLAQQIAVELIDGGLDDITRGATHYYAATMSEPPPWVVGGTFCRRIGNHLFFKDVR